MLNNFIKVQLLKSFCKWLGAKVCKLPVSDYTSLCKVIVETNNQHFQLPLEILKISKGQEVYFQIGNCLYTCEFHNQVYATLVVAKFYHAKLHSK